MNVSLQYFVITKMPGQNKFCEQEQIREQRKQKGRNGRSECIANRAKQPENGKESVFVHCPFSFSWKLYTNIMIGVRRCWLKPSNIIANQLKIIQQKPFLTNYKHEKQLLYIELTYMRVQSFRMHKYIGADSCKWAKMLIIPVHSMHCGYTRTYTSIWMFLFAIARHWNTIV